MDTAILDPSPPNERDISRVVSEAFGRGSPQPQNIHSIATHEDPVVPQLSQLASQHHASEYNRLKFGSKGSLLLYVPYSLQMPDHFQEMQAHQMKCAELRAWWPHDNQSHVGAEEWSARKNETMRCMAASGHLAHPDLREQLSAAISTSIILPQSANARRAATPAPHPHWQTSETHPIVISTIIPSEVLPAISSQVRKASHRYPVIFNVPSTQLLDRLIPPPVDPVTRKTAPPLPVISIAAPRPTPALSSAQSLAKSLKLSSLFWIHPTVRRAVLGNLESPQAPPKKRFRPASYMAPTNTLRSDGDIDSHTRPKIVRNCSSPPAFETEGKDNAPRMVKTDLSMISRSTIVNMAIPAVPAIPAAASARLLGNLYMSSCPGKKVRLDGPVRGRSTVCRDLRSDLTRIKNVGVACIICCLDDIELMSLGVDWVDYAVVASELGIDILRLPIPEGLAPINPEALDIHLTKVIDTYTLRGSAVLVHCRGGVGRAGVVACCWMLKLGLCGWLESQHADTSDSELVDDATVHLIDRLISVVRRRRSPKAIETYEQVRFLVDYVRFLRDRSELSMSPSYLDLFADWDTSVE
ncbi:phosphatases II [Lentinus brumalis]|uniref:Phosphatases II n=1 Tax=Lentinus brumalis TaxID=2498619 RepID=A0A371DBZ2_9APHY|nr:phosphatases II [Polyporus brumalis]